MSTSKSQVVAAIGLLAEIAKLELFDGHPISDAPSVRPHKRALMEYKIQHLLEPQRRNQWALIESIVVFDEISYDRYAFERHKLGAESRRRIALLEHDVLKGETWPIEVYARVKESLTAWRTALKDMNMAGVARAVSRDPRAPYSSANDQFWDAAEKNYHDGLAQNSDRSTYAFADSTDSFERAFFYAELCKELGVGMLPRAYSYPGAPGATSIVNDLIHSYGNCVHHRYTQEHLKAFDQQARSASLAVIFPPLAQKIARLSLETGQTPVEIALEMRQTRHAKAYRRFLADLQQEFRSPSRSSSAHVPKLLEDFRATVAQWAAEGTTKAGVQYRPRTMNVHWIPVAAAVATYLHSGDFKDAIDAGVAADLFAVPWLPKSKTIHDPILFGAPKYLAFVADWYH